MNDELTRWIEDTEAKAAEANAKAAIMLEAAKRAREGEDPREFVLCVRKPLGCLARWTGPASDYTLKPRRLRPWTAKEWGARIGEWFLVDGRKHFLEYASTDSVMFTATTGNQVMRYSKQDDMSIITQLDGSPCGEWEEVQS